MQWKTAENYSATNHCMDKHEVILICLVTLAFISIIVNGAMSFSSHQKLRKYMYMPLLQSMVLEVLANKAYILAVVPNKILPNLHY